MLLNIVSVVENCADSDEMPQDVASHLSLQCLYKYSFMCFQPGMPAKECNATKQGRVNGFLGKELNGPHHNKTCLQGFRQSETRTILLSTID